MLRFFRASAALLLPLACAAQQSRVTVSPPAPQPSTPRSVIAPRNPTTKPHGTVTGVVLDDHGHPVRYARIFLEDTHPPKQSSFVLESGAIGMRSPGSIAKLDGTFVLRNAPPGEYFLSVQAPGYLNPLHRPDLLPPPLRVVDGDVTRASVRLAPAASLEGIVRFDDGSPAIGMAIQVLNGTTTQPSAAWTATSTASTDDTGHWRAAGLVPGEYIVSAAMPSGLRRYFGFLTSSQQAVSHGDAPPLTLYYGGYGTNSATKITLRAAEHRVLAPLVIHPSAFHAVDITVLSKEHHRPVNGGYAFVYSASTGFQTGSPIGLNGKAHFAYVPSGNYKLTVRASDVIPSSFHFAGVDAQLMSGFPDAIRNYHETSLPFQMPDHDLTLPAVETEVQWQKPGTTNATDARMLKPPQGGTTLVVSVLEDTAPAHSARFSRVHLEPVTTDTPAARKVGYAAIAGLDGTVLFHHIPPGEYLVFAELSGFVSPVNIEPALPNHIFSETQRETLLQTLQHVTVHGAASEPQRITLRLHPGAIITGRVAFDDGMPAFGLAVNVLSRNGSVPRQSLGIDLGGNGYDELQSAVTGDQGNFRIAGLPAGTFFLEALIPVGGPNGSDDISFYVGSAGQSVHVTTQDIPTSPPQTIQKNIPIPLHHWKTLRGRISFSGSATLEAVEIDLHSADGKGYARRFDLTGDGTFAIANLPPDTYTLRARGWQLIPGKYNQGRTRTLELRKTLTIAPTGEPPVLLLPLSLPEAANPATR